VTENDQQQTRVAQVHWREEAELHSLDVLHVAGDDYEDVAALVANDGQNGIAVYFDRGPHSELILAAKVVVAVKRYTTITNIWMSFFPERWHFNSHWA
jgi:hypothetical protein